MTDRWMFEHLMVYITDQQEIIEQLREHIVVLERSILMRQASRLLEMPPPG